MRMFVYGMREYDELPMFIDFAEKYGVELGYTGEYLTHDNLHLADGYEAVSILTNTADAETIDHFKANGVKVISTRTIGYDHVDIKHAHEVGMGVCNVTYPPESVADYTIMLMLIACRKMRYIMDKAAVQDYTLKGKLGREISQCTVGVIGTGRIGKTVIEHLKGFGCRMLAYDVYESDSVRENAEYVDLETLYRQSDIITLHAPALESSYHMLNDAAFDLMKEGVIIINCARGQLIDTSALIRNLTNGKVGFAALDVIEKELDVYYKDMSGKILDNPEMAVLRSFYNVYFAPHMAFYTDDAVANMIENSIIGAQAYLNGEDHRFIIK